MSDFNNTVILEKIKNSDEVILAANTAASAIIIDETILGELQTFRVIARDRKDFVTRTGFNTANDLNAIAYALEITQAFKDRVIDMKANLSTIASDLKALKKAVDDHTFKSYGDIISQYKNKETRDWAYDIIAADINNKREQCQKLQDVIEMTLSNLKDTHFSLCEIAVLAKEVFGSRRVKNVMGN